ncbi:unnamed protein product [Urochloa humidicola]
MLVCSNDEGKSLGYGILLCSKDGHGHTTTTQRRGVVKLTLEASPLFSIEFVCTQGRRREAGSVQRDGDDGTPAAWTVSVANRVRGATRFSRRSETIARRPTARRADTSGLRQQRILSVRRGGSSTEHTAAAWSAARHHRRRPSHQHRRVS